MGREKHILDKTCISLSWNDAKELDEVKVVKIMVLHTCETNLNKSSQYWPEDCQGKQALLQ